MEISIEHYNRMAERLTELEYKEAERQWIPCSERLPKYWKELCDGEPTLTSEPVLVCYRKTKCYYSRFAVGEYVGRWIVLDDCAPEEDPIAWMPLPEPYNNGGNE